MAHVIYKYEIPVIGEVFDLELPIGHVICDINHQDDRLYLWAFIDTEAPKFPLSLIVVGTGWIMKNCSDVWFMKSVHCPNGAVFHLFSVHGKERDIV